MGFNAGNGTKSYEYLPYSQTTFIRDLPGTGGANGFPGRHIFRIDEKILPGVCIRDLSTLCVWLRYFLRLLFLNGFDLFSWNQSAPDVCTREWSYVGRGDGQYDRAMFSTGNESDLPI